MVRALVIVQPTQCGVRRLVAAFRTMRRRVAALHKLTHRVNDDQGHGARCTPYKTIAAFLLL